MRNIIIIMAMATLIAVSGCNENQEAVTGGPVKAFIEQTAVEKVIQTLNDSLGEAPKFRIERGVQQVANLWRESDGTVKDFEDFCLGNFVAEEAALENLYRKLERNFEIFNGYFHKMDVLLKEPIQLEGPEIEPVDMMFGSYNAAAHLTDDFFNNKIAFLTALNFPF